MNELVRLIALAAGLGLAAGMVLGGVALLLAAPAYAAEARPRTPHLECLPVLRAVPAASLRLEI